MTLLVLAEFSAAQGVDYFQGDVYSALQTAKKEGKLLLVECYAKWNYKSRWMNEMINTSKKVSEFLDENAIVWQVDTETPGGAQFAQDYKVLDYPSIYVFNKNGSVVNKIDRAMEPEDFIQVLEKDIFALDGGNVWKMTQLEKVAESGDRLRSDKLFGEYLSKVGREDVLKHSHRWIFENSNITFYGSTAFQFLLENRAALSENEKDSVEINGIIHRVMYEYLLEILPEEYDEEVDVEFVSDFVAEILPGDTVLSLLCDLVRSGKTKNYDRFISVIEVLVSTLPEDDSQRMVFHLSQVANNGTTRQKMAARSIVREQMTLSKNPSLSASLKILLNSL